MRRTSTRLWTKIWSGFALLSLIALPLAGHVAAAGAATNNPIVAIGAENEYASVIAQVGGRYVAASAIMSNPNTDPHTFEASPMVAQAVSKASLIVQNGVGYDDFMTKIEQASPNSKRKVIDVQTLLGLPNNTPNPHLWYNPTTMPAVAKAVANDLGDFEPSHRAYFEANATAFVTSLKPWLAEIARLKASDDHAPVATTEPVGDYLLNAIGADNMTPWVLQADIMNGVDPSPQAVSFQESLFTERKVRIFLYNRQVTDSLTETFLNLAEAHHIPVVGVYETMPTPGYTYQSWMLAETDAISLALADKQSTQTL